MAFPSDSNPPMLRPRHDSNANPAAPYDLPKKPELSLTVGQPTMRQYQNAPISPGVTSSIRSHHDSVISHPHSPLTSDPPSPPSIASVSIKGGRESMSPSDPEKGMSPDHGRVQQPPPVAKRDPEKRIVIPVSTVDSRSRTYHANPEMGIEAFDNSDAIELQDKALRILIYLSAFCPIISFVLFFWTLVSLFISLLLLPLRAIISTKLPSLASLLLPPLRLQLRLVYSSWANDDAFEYGKKGSILLVIIHLLSPALAPLTAVASWIAAFFWFFSAVLGDPAGKDGHNDGRAAVLAVRNWWESWLIRGLR